MGEIGEYGYLKIGNEADRLTVASILYKNGYTVKPIRKKKNGKSYEYFVFYQMNNRDEGNEENDG